MKNKKILTMMFCLLFMCSVAGCNQKGNEDSQEAGAETGEESEVSEHASVSTVTLTEGKYSEEKLDDTWEEERAVSLILKDDKISISEGADENYASDMGNIADSVEIDGKTVTITQEGTYVLSGSMEDGQILVDVDKDAVIRLVFNGVSLKCSDSAPVYSKGGNVIITLVEGTENNIEDCESYTYEDEGEDEPDAAIFAKDDLTFNGTGILNVIGNYNHGIHCKDDLKFVTGTYNISSADDGIVGKDSVSVKNGNFVIESGDDGIKAANIEETDKGYVLIEDGSFQITAGGDGIQAETLLRVNDGNLDIVTGGGSENAEKVSGIPAERPDGGRRMPDADQGMPEGMEPGERPDVSQGMPEGTEPGEMPDDGQGAPEGMEPGERPDAGQRMPEGMEPGERLDADRGAPEGMEPDERLDAGQGAPGNMQEPSGEMQESSASADSVSTKALKSYVDLIIEDGEFSIDSCDDGIHSNQNVTIDGGDFMIQAGDDGIHADLNLTVNDGQIDISQSYEGLEGAEITVNNGDIKVTASDDGINAASDDDSASNPETDEVDSSQNKQRGGFMANEDQGAVMTFNGGTICVNAGGDGLDANGDIYINGGDITVHGPENGGNGTLDYASVCKITGGTFIGIGSVGMAQNPSEDSTQPVIVWSMNEAADAGTSVLVKDSNGTNIAEVTTEKKAQWFAVSSPELAAGEKYRICVGDTEREVELSQVITSITM